MTNLATKMSELIPMTDDALGTPAKTEAVEVPEGRIKGAAALLVRGGFLRSVAGDADFFAAAKAWAKSATLRKGLFVWGRFGCGKTHLVNTIKPFNPGMIRLNLGDPAHAEAIDLQKNRSWCEDAAKCSVFLDDLGSEATLNEYGVIRERVGEFITYYHLYGKGLLFVTTNLESDVLESRYTQRVLSRLKDLTIPLHLKGTDKRDFNSIHTTNKP